MPHVPLVFFSLGLEHSRLPVFLESAGKGPSPQTRKQQPKKKSLYCSGHFCCQAPYMDVYISQGSNTPPFFGGGLGAHNKAQSTRSVRNSPLQRTHVWPRSPTNQHHPHVDPSPTTPTEQRLPHLSLNVSLFIVWPDSGAKSSAFTLNIQEIQGPCDMGAKGLCHGYHLWHSPLPQDTHTISSLFCTIRLYLGQDALLCTITPCEFCSHPLSKLNYQSSAQTRSEDFVQPLRTPKLLSPGFVTPPFS